MNVNETLVPIADKDCVKTFKKLDYKPSEELIKKLEERAKINRQNKKNYKKNKHLRRK